MYFQSRSSCFPAKRSFQICSHVLFELQLGSFLSATCHGLQHRVSFCSCCFTVHIWSWLRASAILCPHRLLVGSTGTRGLPPCHARSGVTQETHKDVMLCYVTLRYVISITLQPSVQSYIQQLYDAMPDRRLVYPNIWWTLDGLLR